MEAVSQITGRPRCGKEASVRPGSLRDYVGEYKLFNRSLRIALRDDRLALTLPDFPEKPLFAASANRFFLRTTETEFEFERDAAGKISNLIIHSADGNNIKCLRL